MGKCRNENKHGCYERRRDLELKLSHLPLDHNTNDRDWIFTGDYYSLFRKTSVFSSELAYPVAPTTLHLCFSFFFFPTSEKYLGEL